MEKKNELQKVNNDLSISGSIIQVTKTSDLLRAKPISEQILRHGRNEVSIVLAGTISRCLDSLGIQKTNYEIQVLVEDLILKYKYDSIEDIQIALRDGRCGNYGKVYNQLNLIVISEWMEKHLEKKAVARESQYKESKHNFKTREEYLNAVEVGMKKDKEEKQRKEQVKKDLQDRANEYAKFRAWYDEKKKSGKPFSVNEFYKKVTKIK